HRCRDDGAEDPLSYQVAHRGGGGTTEENGGTDHPRDGATRTKVDQNKYRPASDPDTELDDGLAGGYAHGRALLSGRWFGAFCEPTEGRDQVQDTRQRTDGRRDCGQTAQGDHVPT